MAENLQFVNPLINNNDDLLLQKIDKPKSSLSFQNPLIDNNDTSVSKNFLEFKNPLIQDNAVETYRNIDVSKIVPTRSRLSIDGNDNWWDNFSYGFKLGVTDTARGITQMSTTGDPNAKVWLMEDTLVDQQNELRQRMADPENGVWATIGYFGGAILDPVGWLIPFGKLYNGYKTLSTLQKVRQLSKVGAISGGTAGALGYVDEESYLDTRTKQLIAGAFGGGILAPVVGIGAEKLFRKSNDELINAATDGKRDINIKSLNENEFYNVKLTAEAGKDFRVEPIRKKIVFTERIVKEDIPDKAQSIGFGDSLVAPVKLWYKNTLGDPAWNYLTSGRYGPEIASGVAGGIVGYQVPEEDAPITEKFGSAAIGFITAAGGVKGIKSTPAKWFPEKIQKLAAGGFPGEITQTTSLGELFARGLVDGKGLPQQAKDLKILSQGKSNELGHQIARIAEKAMQLTPGENRVLLNILEGDVAINKIPSKELKNLSKEARDSITELSQMMVDFGLLSQETVNKNLNTWIRRIYGEQGLKDVATIEDLLKPRGIVIDVTKEQYLKRFKKEKAFYYGSDADPTLLKRLLEIKLTDNKTVRENLMKSDEYTNLLKKLNKGTELENHVGWEVFGKSKEDFNKIGKNETISIRWQYTKQERMAMQQIENASLAIAETGRILSGELGKYAFYDSLAKSNLAFTKASNDLIEANNLVKVPTEIIEGSLGKTKFGNLSGKFISREIYDNLVRTQQYYSKTPPEWYSAYKSLNQLWKVSKTAWNPTVHVNNIISNRILYDLVDGDNFTINITKATNALLAKGKNQESELATLAERHGLFEADFVTNELKNITKVLKQNPYQPFGIKQMDEFNQSVSSASIIFNDLKRSWFGLKNAGQFASDLYRFEDNAFRLALFRDRLQKGYDPGKAAIDARRAFIDYNIDAPIINIARETLTPFLAYTYRVVPILAETAVTRPWKYAKWAALGYGINALGGYFSGGDEETERAVMPKEKSGRFMGIGALPYRNLKLPISFGDTTNPTYIDITRFIPGGDILDIKNSFATVPLPGVPTPLQPSLGALGDIIIPLFGYDLFKGEKLQGLGAGIAEDWKTKFLKIGSNITPNFPFFPGSYSTERIERARKNIPSPYRTQETEIGALLKGLGFKFNEADLNVLTLNKVKEMERNLKPYQEKNTILKNKYLAGKINEKEFENKILENAEKTANLIDRYDKKFNFTSQVKNKKEFLPGLLAIPGEFGIPGFPTYDETTRMLNENRQQ